MEKDVKPSTSPEVIRWSVNRKKEVVLRMMRGEPIDALSRELGIEVWRSFEEQVIYGRQHQKTSRNSGRRFRILSSPATSTRWQKNPDSKARGRHTVNIY